MPYQLGTHTQTLKFHSNGVAFSLKGYKLISIQTGMKSGHVVMQQFRRMDCIDLVLDHEVQI